MKRICLYGLTFAVALTATVHCSAQSTSSIPVKLGESGIAWYCRWDTALSEAKRSNRPILFMAASSQCSGVPGVF